MFDKQHLPRVKSEIAIVMLVVDLFALRGLGMIISSTVDEKTNKSPYYFNLGIVIIIISILNTVPLFVPGLNLLFLLPHTLISLMILIVCLLYDIRLIQASQEHQSLLNNNFQNTEQNQTYQNFNEKENNSYQYKEENAYYPKVDN
jgi:hypothetical protein